MSLPSVAAGLGLVRKALGLRNISRLCTHSGIKNVQSRAFHATTPALTIKINDFQLRKITQDFDHVFDSDRDGFIDHDDIQDFKRRLRKYMEMVKGKAMKDVYKAGLDDYWDIMLEEADTNKDGFISREEWVHIWEHIIKKADGKVTPAALPQWVQMMPQSLFPVIDVKADGIIDEDEYREFWHHVGGYRWPSDEELQRYFAHMTQNYTKPINQERMLELFADFYLSSDHDTPGRYIAGPIRYRFSD